MNINRKTCQFILVLICLFTIIAPHAGFGTTTKLTYSIVDNPRSEKNSDESILLFNEPSTQQITIENHLKKDVNIGHMYFIGDEFTAPLIARGVSIQGSSGCTTIKAGTACTFLINAKENASATINPAGELLLVNYKVAGDKKDKFFKLKIKINYNDDIFFGVRNIKFLKKEGRVRKYYNYPETIKLSPLHGGKGTSYTYYDSTKSGETRELTIINNNPQNSVHIKSVKFGREGVDGEVDYSACSFLTSNEFCTAKIFIDYETKNDLIPILVTYDIVGKETKTDIVAAAVAIVNYAPQNYTVESGQPGLALLSGAASGSLGVISGLVTDKKVLIAVISNGKAADIGANIIAGPLAGAAFWSADEFVNGVGIYDNTYGYNRLIDASAMHFAFATIPCASVGLKASTIGYFTGLAVGAACMAVSIGCGLAGTFGGYYLTEAVYYNLVNRLPEQSWSTCLWDKSQEAFNFGVAAIIRMGCKIALNSIDIPYKYFYDGGLTGGAIEIGQDVLSGAMITVIDEMASSIEAASLKNRSILIV